MKTIYKLTFGIITLMLLVGLTTATITNNGDGTHTISYTVSTETAIEMKDALCHNYDYQSTLIDEETGEETPNPETCTEYADKQVKNYIKEHIVAYRHHIKQEEAKAEANAMSEPIIT